MKKLTCTNCETEYELVSFLNKNDAMMVQEKRVHFFSVFLTACILAIGFNIQAQEELILIKDIGSIRMPSTLEVQDGSFKDFIVEWYQSLGYEYESDLLVFQQKGLNSFEKESYQTYVRVMIKTVYGDPKESFGSSKNRLGFTTTQLKEIETELRKQIEDELAGYAKLSKWLSVKELVVNGMYCIFSAYQRQMAEKPIVQVERYIFYNTNRIHILTLSYRVNESAKWKPVLDKMRDSFTIKWQRNY
jgi:hypothetical protein